MGYKMIQIQLTLLLFSLFICGAQKCNKRLSVFNVYDYKIYTSPEIYAPNNKKMQCFIHMKTYRPDERIRVKFESVKLKNTGNCEDHIIVHDGASQENITLMKICNESKAKFESSGENLLLVFNTTGSYESDSYGFTLKYMALHEGSEDEDENDDEDDAISTHGILGISFAGAVLIFAIIIVLLVLYRWCTYRRRVKNNLAVTGHTPEDLVFAVTTSLKIAQTDENQDGNRVFKNSKPSDVRAAGAKIRDQASKGPIVEGQNPLQNYLLQRMDDNAASRTNTPRPDDGWPGIKRDVNDKQQEKLLEEEV